MNSFRETTMTLYGIRLSSALRIITRAATVFSLLTTVFYVGPAAASSVSCDHAARTAARKHGLPPDILLAITRVETGRNHKSELSPWPWTVNMKGAGHWFDTEKQALSFVFQHFKNGARSFDVGCFQINYKWHSTAFRTIEDMFDPGLGADYAAQLLKGFYAELGSWSLAAGAYHSRTPELARKYTARFDIVRASVSGGDAIGNDRVRPVNQTARPLIGFAPPQMGSLVTFQNAGRVTDRSLIKQN